jgi:hypothetical protein
MVSVVLIGVMAVDSIIKALNLVAFTLAVECFLFSLWCLLSAMSSCEGISKYDLTS